VRTKRPIRKAKDASLEETSHEVRPKNFWVRNLKPFLNMITSWE
jgi:hypothetical protein